MSDLDSQGSLLELGRIGHDCLCLFHTEESILGCEFWVGLSHFFYGSESGDE